VSRIGGPSRLHLGRPEEFSKTALWRLYGGAPVRNQRRRGGTAAEAGLLRRLADYVQNVLARHW